MFSDFDTSVMDCVNASPSVPFCLKACGGFSLHHCLTLIKELEIRPLLSACDFSTLYNQFSSFAQPSLRSYHITNCHLMKVVALYFLFPTCSLENTAKIKGIGEVKMTEIIILCLKEAKLTFRD